MVLKGKVPELRSVSRAIWLVGIKKTYKLGAPATVEAMVGKLDCLPPRRQMIVPGAKPCGLVSPAILNIVEVWREEIK